MARASCTIESRIGSSRLPGKALYPFFDTTLLGSVIRNARSATCIRRVIVCTSTAARDQVIADYAETQGAEVFRGDEEDVAGRIAAALEGEDGLNVFLTGDNPVVTPDLIDLAVQQADASDADFLCSTHMKYCDWWTVPPVLPKGLSVQVSKTDFFHDAVAASTDPSIRQHSTMVMYGTKKPGRSYRALELPFTADLDMTVSYTVDTPAEYAGITRRWASRPVTLAGTLGIAG